MPNRISLLPQSLYGLTHDPTKTLQGDPLGFLGANPYAAMVEEIIFGAIKSTLSFFAQFASSFPVFGALIAPFLEALVDLADDIPETMIEFLTDPIAWAIRILNFVITFARGFPVFGPLIAPFLDAVEGLVNDDAAIMIEFLTNPIAWSKRILRFLLGFLRGIPVLSELIAPFLDAIDDLVNDIPDTLTGFLDPIAWAKRLLRFSSQFIRGVPVLGDQIAPFLDGIDGLVSEITDATPMLNMLNPATWMGWVSSGFLSQFGLDFNWLGGLSGLDLGSGANFFTGVSGALGNPAGLMSGAPVFGSFGSIPLLGPLMPLFGGAANASEAGNFFTSWLGLLGNPTGMLTGAPSLGGISGIPLFDPLASAFLGGGLPINVSGLFGSLPLNLFSGVPIGALTDQTPNLLPQGMFPAGSIAVGDGWSEDAAKTATADSTGSAKHAADGKNHALRSIPIAVLPGKSLDLSVKVWWQSLVSTGAPIQLGILKYKNNIEVSRSILASTAASGTSSGWTTLSVNYVVPADGSVDMIKLRPILGSTATAGNVWYDDATVEQPGDIQQDWVKDLVPQLTGVLDLFGLSSLDDLIGIDVGAIWTLAINSILNPLGALEDTLARFNAQEIIDRTLTAVNGIPIVGGTLAEFLTAMDEIFNTALDGQSLGTTATGDLAGLLTDLSTVPNTVIGTVSGTLAQTKISGLVTDLIDRVTYSGGADSFDDLRNRLWNNFGGTSGGTNKDNLDVAAQFATFFAKVADAPAAWSNLTTRTTRLSQTMQVIRGDTITAVDSYIQGMKNWFDAQTWTSWTHT
jgi:hypothetical protein